MKKKEDYFALYADDEPYTYVHPTESVVKSMPEPFEGDQGAVASVVRGK